METEDRCKLKLGRLAVEAFIKINLTISHLMERKARQNFIDAAA